MKGATAHKVAGLPDMIKACLIRQDYKAGLFIIPDNIHFQFFLPERPDSRNTTFQHQIRI